MEILQYTILGFAPGVFWVWYLRHKDDLEPEPRHLVVWVFALGCHGPRWLNLARAVVEAEITGAWIAELAGS